MWTTSELKLNTYGIIFNFSKWSINNYFLKKYQIYSHSKSYRKYKNIDCRYSFGRFFTIIAYPLPDHMSEDEKESILHNRNAILNVVKEYIDTYLDPRKVNILSPLKAYYVKRYVEGYR